MKKQKTLSTVKKVQKTSKLEDKVKNFFFKL